ncbi:MAG TPA: hypothetical protein VMV34_07800 [Terriglobia bacterium]|nr:hypothetical protein [Terriglobia bacterium]
MEEGEIKLKVKKNGQRVCDEKDAKGKLCLGHLKRWYTMPAEVMEQLGKDSEIYRCDKCHVLYHPSVHDRSSAGQKFQEQPVNLLGDTVYPRRK